MAALGGLQRNQSAGHLDELGHKAQELAERARQQQDQLRDLNSHSSGMIDARQKLADDVGRLEQTLRDAERETLKGNRQAASKLRDALSGLDESNIQSRLQASADHLRMGYNPGGNSSEGDIPDELAKLGESVRQASRAAGGAPAPDEALTSVQHFRERLAQMDRATQQGAAGDKANASTRAGNQASTRSGGVTAAGGGAGGHIDGGWNTGNNPHSGRSVAAADTSPTPEDLEKNFDQGLADLQNVRRAVADDPVAKRQVDDLIRSMQHLDPRRFPGNPEVVDQLFAEVRSGVDRLELQLGHDPADDNRNVVRNAESLPVPEGYQEAVAEYYRRLSKGQ
jgi:hypothetical protein